MIFKLKQNAAIEEIYLVLISVYQFILKKQNLPVDALMDAFTD